VPERSISRRNPGLLPVKVELLTGQDQLRGHDRELPQQAKKFAETGNYELAVVYLEELLSAAGHSLNTQDALRLERKTTGMIWTSGGCLPNGWISEMAITGTMPVMPVVTLLSKTVLISSGPERLHQVLNGMGKTITGTDYSHVNILVMLIITGTG
jgi:hypothetical protein